MRKVLEIPTILYNRIKVKIYNVKTGENIIIRGKIRFSRFGNIRIGDNCMINASDKYNPIGCGDGCNIIAEKTGAICIGNNLGMSNSTIYSRISINIGNNVLIGGGVRIYDTDFHSLDATFRGTKMDKVHTKNEPIIIEDHVYIGANSIILKGVHIGKNSIIGAGSIVTKNIPDNEIWAGNPAKKIRKV